MSVIKDAKWNILKLHMERFESAAEVADTCRSRKRTDNRFTDMTKDDAVDDWNGVKSYDDALELLRTGYQPTVDAIRSVVSGKMGESKRFAFQNDIQGFAPIVPLALKGVPNSMLNMTMKPIKAKVIDVYYDMTASCAVSSESIIKAGQKLLGAIVALEKQGYRFNLYAVQSYSDNKKADMLVVKVKSSSQSLDLKRVSFPLTHTAFFRVIGFDWYSKVPGGTYRWGYGHGLAYDYNETELQQMAEQTFGKTSIYFSAAKIINKDEAHIKEVLTNADSKN